MTPTKNVEPKIPCFSIFDSSFLTFDRFDDFLGRLRHRLGGNDR